MVPSLRFIYHEEVRSSAAQALPALLASCAAAAKLGRPGASATSAKQLLDFMLQPLLDAAAKVPLLSGLQASCQRIQMDCHAEQHVNKFSHACTW